jgi:hypothetical protein
MAEGFEILDMDDRAGWDLCKVGWCRLKPIETRVESA